MPTSLGRLLDALTEATLAGGDRPADLADAAGALRHLGRALGQLRSDGVSAIAGDRREQQVAALAAACTEVAVRAPIARLTLTRLAGAAADTVAVLRPRSTGGGRWAAAVELTDAIAAVCEVLDRGLPSGGAAHWVAEVRGCATQLQQAAALDPPTRSHAALLDQPLADPAVLRSSGRAADPAAVIPEATAVLLQATAATGPPPTLAEVLAYTLAAETLARTTTALLPGHTTPGHSPAADAWHAVRTALRPFDDGSRRPHPHPPPGVAVAGRLHAVLASAPDEPGRWPPPARAAVATAVQHLPALAVQLRDTVRHWGATGTLLAFACDLPPSEPRVQARLAGHRTDGLVHADAFDLRPATEALHAARLRSAVVALAVTAADRRTAPAFPRRAAAAHRELLAPYGGSAALDRAAAQARQRPGLPRPGAGRHRPR